MARELLYDQPLAHSIVARVTTADFKRWNKMLKDKGERVSSAYARHLLLKLIEKHEAKKVKSNG